MTLSSFLKQIFVNDQLLYAIAAIQLFELTIALLPLRGHCMTTTERFTFRFSHLLFDEVFFVFDFLKSHQLTHTIDLSTLY